MLMIFFDFVQISVEHQKTILEYYSGPLCASAVLTHGHHGQLPRSPRAQGPHANLCMLSMTCFFYCLINTDFVGSTNTINICLILSTFTFLFLSVVVQEGPPALLCKGAYYECYRIDICCVGAREKTNCLRIGIIHMSGATCLSTDGCFSELTQSHEACWSTIMQTLSSSHQFNLFLP